MIRTLLLLAALSTVGLTSWSHAPAPARTFVPATDTIPFRGVANDTLGRFPSHIPGWGSIRWPCQDSIRAGTGTAFVWPVTTLAGDTLPTAGSNTLTAAWDSAKAHQSFANCHDIPLIHGGLYRPSFGTARYDDTHQIRVSGQTARGEGVTFGPSYSSAESRGAFGRIYENFRIRANNENGGLENLFKCRACSGINQLHLSVAWASTTNNLLILEGGTDVVPLLSDTAFNHTIYRNLTFEPDSGHATHLDIGSGPSDTLPGASRRIRKVSVIGNLFHGFGRRLPRLAQNVDSSSVIDNIAYNWQNWAGQLNAHSEDGPTGRIDWIGYHAKPGPLSADTIMPLRIGENDSTFHRVTVRDIQGQQNGWAVNADPASLVRGPERVVGCEDVGPLAWCGFDDDEVPLIYFSQDTMPTGPPWAEYEIMPFDSARRAALLNEVGNSWSLGCNGQRSAFGAQRDSIDTRAINEFNAGTGAGFLAVSVERSVGVPADGADCSDTDGDVLPDAYELAQCGTTTCIPSWGEWVNGRWAGDWYLWGCNLDGTLVGARATTACGGEALASSASFGNVSRYVYFVDMQTLFGLSFPNFTPISEIAYGILNPAEDSMMVVSCTQQGAPVDSATVEARVSAWNRPGVNTALLVRDFDPFSGISC